MYDVITHGRSFHRCDQNACGLLMEGWMVSMTKMHEGYTWMSFGKCNQKASKLHVEHHKKFEFEIHQNLIHTLAWCYGSGLEE